MRIFIGSCLIIFGCALFVFGVGFFVWGLFSALVSALIGAVGYAAMGVLLAVVGSILLGDV